MVFDSTIILLIPAMLFAFYAQAKVSSAYKRYAAVGNRKRMTGAQAARRILDSNGLNDVRIEMVNGTLSDHYDPRKRVLRLSPKVYNEPSIASASIAAHECGHAIQHAKSYMPLTFRNAIAPIVSIVSNLSWPLLIIGMIAVNAGYYTNGTLIFDLGILFFAGVVVFHAVTLPVEFNASRRAIQQMESLGVIYQEEVPAAKKVLSAAAMTYVAALAVAVANLIRILLIRGRER
ncbi:zinc metallopeptidase [Clostridium aminobutyricum]|uniref:Zinc metallopeptidase n=1 Tax=Clostridium aminobutyricum TaxID=33953 RepID=A0A939IHZ3_CLOAM|nr:zinc metallopeptidase [Clostridium aminobutyricum]MBN7772048.1 zinc metallopeptidase [Clostridium aminobutyricum]